MKKILLTLSTLILSIAANADTASDKSITVHCLTTLFDTKSPSNNPGWIEKIYVLNEASPGQDHFENGIVLARGKNTLIGLIRGINSPNELLVEIFQSKTPLAKNIEDPDRYVNREEYQNLSRPFVAAGESKVGTSGDIGSEGFTVSCEIKN